MIKNITFIRNGSSAVMHIKGLNDIYNPAYMVTNITGLGPVAAEVNVTNYAGRDGGIINSTRIPTRNITVTGAFGGNIEANREYLIDICKPGQFVTVLVVHNTDLNIDNEVTKTYYGVVEAMDVEYFGQMVGFQISVICPEP